MPAAQELDFLHPLPVERLWGVGAITAAKLHERGITTVGEVAALDERSLVAMLGRGSGRHLHALAHNRDPRAVRVGVRRRSIGAQRALGSRRRRSLDELDATLVGLVERVAPRLRSGKRVVPDGRAADALRRLQPGDPVAHAALADLGHRDAADRAAPAARRGRPPLIRDQGLTLIGITLANLDPVGAIQLELPFGAPGGVGVLDGAVDAVREKFGKASLTRGVLLGRDQGLTVPLLPD